jgi:recombination protein RecT
LFEVTQGDIRMIVCTHSHADHSPGAKPLQVLCSSAKHGAPLIHGLPNGPHASSNSYFKPDKVLQNKERIRLVSCWLEVYSTTTLEVVFTPGHAENHVCLVMVEDKLLLSGDHILNGSTTVINPPDGHMGDYLESLDTLSDICKKYEINHILPAHGYVLDQAPQVIAHLKAHRLRREAKIAAIMQAQPEGTLDDWVTKAYDDAPKHLWPVAKRSLLAHVQRIRSLQ